MNPHDPRPAAAALARDIKRAKDTRDKWDLSREEKSDVQDVLWSLEDEVRDLFRATYDDFAYHSVARMLEELTAWEPHEEAA